MSRQTRLIVMNFLRRRSAAVTVLALAAAVLTPATAGAQDGLPPEELTCFGITVSDAEERGYRVQIGTAGSDVLVGGNTTLDMLIGLGGDDVLSGAGANDIICGGDGDDILTGGSGDDRVDGGNGNDEIDLSSGADTGRGGAGHDRLIGGSGDDDLDGGTGRDRLSGEDGADLLHGRGGDDVLFGGPGDDQMLGGSGNDRMGGGPDRDGMRGGRGDDILSGNGKRDRLNGGPGDDVLDGDDNRDVLNGSSGRDRCDTTGRDILRRCEIDFAGNDLTRPPEPEPEPEPDPAPSPDPAPPVGDPVPAADAPQGVNAFGWPLLTDTGLVALLDCESNGRHDINTGNSFYGGVQWLPATWNAATVRAGFPEYNGVLPHLVPADVQDQVAKHWWSITRPNTQWPHCHRFALTAMNVLAP